MSIMVQNRPSSHRSPFNLITFAMRTVALCYGGTAYFVFLGTFLYAVGFVSQYIVPKTIDTGAVSPLPKALLVDLLLMSIFAVQHSGMARQGFKKLFAQIASPVIERSSYVLLASLTLLLLFWQCHRLADCALQHLPNQPFRAVRFDAGDHAFCRTHHCARQVQDAGPVSPDPASDLSRVHHRVLVDACHDAGTSVVCCGDDGVHLRWYLA